MDSNMLSFQVVGLNVTIEEGFKLRWQGRDIESGRVVISLSDGVSAGVIRYAEEKVRVDFRVKIEFPELEALLADMGADPGLAGPLAGIIHSEGVVFPDHCFRLAGKAELGAHRLFDGATTVDILAPSRCKPDKVAMSGDEIRTALREGHPVSWNFNPVEKRVAVVLPQALGGYQHLLCLAGTYTFRSAISKGATDSHSAPKPQQLPA